MRCWFFGVFCSFFLSCSAEKIRSYTKHLDSETKMMKDIAGWEKQNVSSQALSCQSFYGEAKKKYLNIIEDQFDLIDELMGLRGPSNSEESQWVVKNH